MESIKLKEKIVNLEKRLDTIDDDKSKNPKNRKNCDRSKDRSFNSRK
jgi:hypothetical protein